MDWMALGSCAVAVAGALWKAWNLYSHKEDEGSLADTAVDGLEVRREGGTELDHLAVGETVDTLEVRQVGDVNIVVTADAWRARAFDPFAWCKRRRGMKTA